MRVSCPLGRYGVHVIYVHILLYIILDVCIQLWSWGKQQQLLHRSKKQSMSPTYTYSPDPLYIPGHVSMCGGGGGSQHRMTVTACVGCTHHLAIYAQQTHINGVIHITSIWCKFSLISYNFFQNAPLWDFIFYINFHATDAIVRLTVIIMQSLSFYRMIRHTVLITRICKCACN